MSVFPLDQAQCYSFFSGRYALAAAIEALGLAPHDRLLVPSYNCGVELDPLLYHRLDLLFYNVQRDFCVDLEDLADKCKKNPKGVLVTHYLGFPQPIEEIRELCRRQGLLCIEDCAHSFLSGHRGRPLGSFGDVAIFSLLKTLPVATGGLLVVNGSQGECIRDSKPPRRFPVWFYMSELAAKRSYDDNLAVQDALVRMASRGVHLTLKGVKIGIAGFSRVFNQGGELLVRPDGFTFEETLTGRGMSERCRRTLAQTDLLEVRSTRRRNYTYLAEHFRTKLEMKVPFPYLPRDVCPLFFPILVEDKDVRQELYRALRDRGIITHPWWDRFRPEVPWEEFPDAVCLKERVMGLPIHQDLGIREMDRVIEEFEIAYLELKL